MRIPQPTNPTTDTTQPSHKPKKISVLHHQAASTHLAISLILTTHLLKIPSFPLDCNIPKYPLTFPNQKVPPFHPFPALSRPSPPFLTRLAAGATSSTSWANRDRRLVGPMDGHLSSIEACYKFTQPRNQSMPRGEFNLKIEKKKIPLRITDTQFLGKNF
ncbi:hypothetical protein O6H91_04G047000 [Diphasiastrum complanatum]|uniref:Uncharacterized protein n=1 Tax=Diphasiastrum complanatum TaxID=34168 RepID=A0ACC2DWK3_DIPCM|nr:hypothetical protein O6H91_04G047000 [Diphasiastrum complanatum]